MATWRRPAQSSGKSALIATLLGRRLKIAHLLRWRPPPYAQRTESTRRVRRRAPPRIWTFLSLLPGRRPGSRRGGIWQRRRRFGRGGLSRFHVAGRRRVGADVEGA